MRSAQAWIIPTIAMLVLSGCGADRDIRLRSFANNAGGPEEFAVLPGKPLQAPPSYSALPRPTPGGSNLTDQNPMGDAVAALGGNPAALQPGAGIPAGDAALLRHAGRNGIDGAIRATLAAEDEDFRRRKSRFTRIRLAPVDRYVEVYRPQTLDPHAEAERFRRVAIPTPTAPPEN